MLTILKTLIGWGVIAVIGVNLIGLILRGLAFAPPAIEAPSERARALLANESRRIAAANSGLTVLGLLLAASYLFALYHFWNLWLALAAAVIMAGRIPDLLWQLRNGTSVNAQDRPQGAVYMAATLLLWGALPLVWYSFCR